MESFKNKAPLYMWHQPVEHIQFFIRKISGYSISVKEENVWGYCFVYYITVHTVNEISWLKKKGIEFGFVTKLRTDNIRFSAND